MLIAFQLLRHKMAWATSLLSMGNKEQVEDEADVVIKVKYGDILRRFSVFVHRGAIECSLNQLRTKVSSLFKFSNDAILLLTYTDEDGDVVALDNDDEFRDAVVYQKLNPLRLTAQLKPYSTDSSYSRPNGVRTTDNVNYAVENSLKPVPDPLHGFLTNLSLDAIRTASTAPVVSELLLLLFKVQLTNVSQSSRAVDLNTCDELKVSNDLQNQFLIIFKRCMELITHDNVLDP